MKAGDAHLARGIETPTAEDLARLDRKRKGKSNEDWVSISPGRRCVDAAPTAEDPAECVTDKGYHSRAVFLQGALDALARQSHKP